MSHLYEHDPREKQLRADRNLLKRIDEYAKNLSPRQIAFVESLTRWLESGKVLTDAQRGAAEDIDERYVE